MTFVFPFSSPHPDGNRYSFFLRWAGSRRLLIVFGLLFMLVTPRCTSPVLALKLRYRMKHGETYYIKTGIAAAAIMQMPMMEEPMKMQARGLAYMRQQVRDVSPEGIMELWNEVTSGVVNMRADGEEEKMPLPKEVTIARLTPRGKVVSLKKQQEETEGENGDAEMLRETLGFDSEALLGQIPALIFPEGEVQVGSKWDEEYAVEIEEGETLKVRCHAVFSDMVELLGYECAKIRALVSIPIEGSLFGEERLPVSGMALEARGYARGELTYYFAPVEGFVVCTIGSVSVFNHASLSMSPEGEQLDPGAQEMHATVRMKVNIKSFVQKRLGEKG